MDSNTLKDLSDMSDNKSCPTRNTRRIVRFEKPSLKIMIDEREECNASQEDITKQFDTSPPLVATGSCSQKLNTISSPCQNKGKSVALRLARIRSLCNLNVGKQCESQDKIEEINKVSSTDNNLKCINSSLLKERGEGELIESTEKKLLLSEEIFQQNNKYNPSDKPSNQNVVTVSAAPSSEAKVLEISNGSRSSCEPLALKSSHSSVRNDAPQVEQQVLPQTKTRGSAIQLRLERIRSLSSSTSNTSISPAPTPPPTPQSKPHSRERSRSELSKKKVISRCFNCSEDGHWYQHCPRPHRKNFCRSCGCDGLDSENCPRCGYVRGTKIVRKTVESNQILARHNKSNVRPEKQQENLRSLAPVIKAG